MLVNIQNQNGPEGREIPGDDLALHWYVPFRSPATRRSSQSRPYIAMTGSAMLWATSSALQVLKPPTRSLTTALATAVHSACTTWLARDSLNPWFRLALQPLAHKLAPRPPTVMASFAGFITRHAVVIKAVLRVGALGLAAYACWTTARHWFDNSKPYEPEGVNHVALMTEVTQEEAMDAPTHFACPAGLRAHIVEKVMMCERTPALIQRVKSIAGKYCDERGVSQFDRPQWIAGACAAAMTVTSHELDLLSYERSWSVQKARKLLRRHHDGAAPEPRNNPGFWQWLLGPGRR